MGARPCGQLPCVDLPAFYTVASGAAYGRQDRAPAQAFVACVPALHRFSNPGNGHLFLSARRSVVLAGPQMGPGFFLTGSGKAAASPEHRPLPQQLLFKCTDSSALSYQAASCQLVAASIPALKGLLPGSSCSGLARTPDNSRAFRFISWRGLDDRCQFGRDPAIRAGRFGGTNKSLVLNCFFQAYSVGSKRRSFPAQLGNT